MSPYPTGARPTSPPGSPGYGRAAAVPPPPRRPDTAYFPPAGPPTGNTQDNGRSTAIILGILIGVLVLLLLIGIAYAINRSHNSAGNRPNGSGGSTATHQATSTGTVRASGNLVAIPCSDLKKRTPAQAKKTLEENGFTVQTVQVTGGKAGEIADISPCQARRGDTITVAVATGKGGTPSSAPASQNCGGIGAPIAGCPSASAAASASPTP
jgi:hypothetical protein